MALTRTLHIYLTLFAFLGLLLFSVSGFIIHNPDWFPDARTYNKDLHLAPELVTAPADKLDRFQIAERLRTEGKISGAVRQADTGDGKPDPEEGFSVDDKTITLTFAGPGRISDVTIYRAADDIHKPGDTHIVITDSGFTGLIGDLHQGKATGPYWSLVIDLVSITLCLASLTGLIMWTQLTKRRTIGLACLLGGSAIIIGIYLFIP